MTSRKYGNKIADGSKCNSQSLVDSKATPKGRSVKVAVLTALTLSVLGLGGYEVQKNYADFTSALSQRLTDQNLSISANLSAAGCFSGGSDKVPSWLPVQDWLGQFGSKLQSISCLWDNFATANIINLKAETAPKAESAGSQGGAGAAQGDKLYEEHLLTVLQPGYLSKVLIDIGSFGANERKIKKFYGMIFGLQKIYYKERREEPEFDDGCKFSDYADAVYGINVSFEPGEDLYAAVVKPTSKKFVAFKNIGMFRGCDGQGNYNFQDLEIVSDCDYAEKLYDVLKQNGKVNADDPNQMELLGKNGTEFWVIKSKAEDGSCTLSFNGGH